MIVYKEQDIKSKPAPVLYAVGIEDAHIGYKIRDEDGRDIDPVVITYLTNEPGGSGKNQYITHRPEALAKMRALLEEYGTDDLLEISGEQENDALRCVKGARCFINTAEVAWIKATDFGMANIFFPGYKYLNVSGERCFDLPPSYKSGWREQNRHCLDMAEAIADQCPGFTGLRGRERGVFANALAFRQDRMSRWWNTVHYYIYNRPRDGDSGSGRGGPIDFHSRHKAKQAYQKLLHDVEAARREHDRAPSAPEPT